MSGPGNKALGQLCKPLSPRTLVREPSPHLTPCPFTQGAQPTVQAWVSVKTLVGGQFLDPTPTAKGLG